MTVRDCIREKLRAFGISEALMPVAAISLDADISDIDEVQFGKALTGVFEEAILAPKQTSVSESGFSVSWDFSGAGRYYLWMCRKYGVTPAPEVQQAAGLSTITDRTDTW